MSVSKSWPDFDELFIMGPRNVRGREERLRTNDPDHNPDFEKKTDRPRHALCCVALVMHVIYYIVMCARLDMEMFS